MKILDSNFLSFNLVTSVFLSSNLTKKFCQMKGTGSHKMGVMGFPLTL